MLVLLDNYDSFTYNLYDYFQQLGASVKVIRNDAMTLDELAALKPEGLILSPGPGRPENAGIMMDAIHLFKESIPILGICLGHQALGLAFGAQVVKGLYPMHGKVSQLTRLTGPIFHGLQPPLSVCRYHSLVLNECPPNFEIGATDQDGLIMAISHIHLPVWGIQYHPEAFLTDGGQHVLNNWLKLFTLR